MHRQSFRPLASVLFCIALLLSLLPSVPVYAAPPQQQPATSLANSLMDTAGDKWGYASVVLSTDTALTPGATANMALQVTSRFAAPDATITWQLPDGGELIGDASELSGAMAAGVPVVSTRQVRFPAEGVYRVMASATIAPNHSVTVAPLGVLYFTVSHSAPAVGTRNPNPVDPRSTPMEMTIISAEEGRNVVDPASVEPAAISETDDPCFNIVGKVTRWENRPTSGGNVLQPSRVPVANAVIEMREEDTFFDDSYGTKLTGADGGYSFSFCDDDGVFDDELELYVRLRAELKDGGFTVVEVEDSSWIDEVYEFDSNIRESEGGNFTIDFALSLERSVVFNIADAVWKAWAFWNASGGAVDDDAYFSESAEVHWEVDYGDDVSHYDPFWGEITIADESSDPDGWDDSVIMHEWGHMADDLYGCDDNGGGPHNVDQFVDPELAWGEGYPDYYQSAVRQANGYAESHFYFDVNGMNQAGQVNLETFDSTRTDDKLSNNHEMAIAAMLWDLNDTAQDGRQRTGEPAVHAPFDRVSHGHTMIQRAYTDPVFESNGDVFDDDCTAFVYLLSWAEIGLPTDGPTAEAVTKNINIANPFGTGGTLAAADATAANGATAGATPAEGDAILAAPSGAEDYQWWKRFTMVVDNSASMAGVKIDGIKTLIKDQANGLANDPDGVQYRLYTFNNTQTAVTRVFDNYFTAADAQAGIDTVATSGAGDPSCQTNGLGALGQAVQKMRGGQAWLYTDGDSLVPPSASAMKQLLNDRGVRGSVVLLVGCGTLPPSNPDRSGAAIAYLGDTPAANASTGIVPYLLTALGSGGQFFYVNQDQLGNINDVLRAQLSHTAGAGRWSDYVSDDFTYTWDRIDAPDWQWFPIDLSTDRGILTTYLDEPLGSESFNYWGVDRDVARVYQNGYIFWDPCTGVFCPIFSSAFIEPLYKNPLGWAYEYPPPAVAAEQGPPPAPLDDQMTALPFDPTQLGLPEDALPAEVAAKCFLGNNHYYTQLHLYRGNLGINEWVILTWSGESNEAGLPCRDFQVWLNLQDGRIRFLYNHVTSATSGGARIGLRQTYDLISVPDDEVIVAENSLSGATNGAGYLFTPAPPQPTRVHTVTVDSLMESVGFLQTGYSGNFEQMIVTDPNGNVIPCQNSGGIICLSVDNVTGDRMVQYIQVDVNGRTGVWSATIDAGASRKSTYSFTGLAASQIEAAGSFDRQRASFKTGPLLVGLGRAVDGNQLTAWLQTPAGKPWGNPFTLFDDGLHGDGQAGDGQFGLLDHQPPGEGVGYLWVKGKIGGQDFQRMEPVPINFQPFELRSLNAPILPNDGSPMALWFSFENRDSVTRCFIPSITVPQGWTAEWNLETGYPCPAAGATVFDFFTVYPDWATGNAAEMGDVSPAEIDADYSGAIATIAISAQDTYNDAIADSAETRLMRARPVDEVTINDKNLGHYLRANGTDQITIDVEVVDETGVMVGDGTLVELATTMGTLASNALTTVNGRVFAVLTAPTTVGDATVTATSSGISDTAIVSFRNPIANQIALAATPTNLGAGKTANVVATVRDAWGSPVAGASVRIGVDGDGQSGQITGGEVMTGTTNAQGQVAVVFTRAGIGWSSATIRADLLKPVIGRDDVAQSAYVTLSMTGGSQVIFLPLVDK